MAFSSSSPPTQKAVSSAPPMLGSSSLIQLSTCSSLHPGYVGPPGSSAFLAPRWFYVSSLLSLLILDNLPKNSFLLPWTCHHHRSLSQGQSCFLWEALPGCTHQWYFLLSMNFYGSQCLIHIPSPSFLFICVCLTFLTRLSVSQVRNHSVLFCGSSSTLPRTRHTDNYSISPAYFTHRKSIRKGVNHVKSSDPLARENSLAQTTTISNCTLGFWLNSLLSWNKMSFEWLVQDSFLGFSRLTYTELSIIGSVLWISPEKNLGDR